MDSEDQKRPQYVLITDENLHTLALLEQAVAIIQNNCFTYLSDALLKITGYTRNQLINKPVESFVMPEEKNKVRQNFAKILTGEITFSEYTISTDDNKQMFIRTHSIPVVYQGATGILGIIRDISEQKKAQEILQKEKDKLGIYLDVAGVIIVAIDNNGCVSLINQKGCEVLGYDKDEVIGRNWFDNFLPVNIRETVKELSRKMLSGELEINEYFINPVLTKNKEERIIGWRGVILRDATGKIIGHLSSGEDITEQKKAQQEIIKEREFIRSIIRSLPGIFYVFNNEGRFLQVNAKLTEVTGYSLEEIFKMHPLDFFIGEDKNTIAAAIRKVFEIGETVAEANVLSKSGKLTPYYLTGVRTEIEGKVLLVGVGIDVSPRVNMEEELRKKIKDLERFNKFAVGREQMMIKLKTHIKELEAKVKGRLK